MRASARSGCGGIHQDADRDLRIEDDVRNRERRLDARTAKPIDGHSRDHASGCRDECVGKCLAEGTTAFTAKRLRRKKGVAAGTTFPDTKLSSLAVVARFEQWFAHGISLAQDISIKPASSR